MKYCSLLLLFFFIHSANAQYDYIPVFKELEGNELLTAVVNEYKPASVLSYSDARELMYTDIDNVDDFVTGIYSDHKILLPPNTASPIQFLLMNNSTNGINCEHSYPQSKGAGDGNARSDMHHLFPARAQVNSGRGSKPFDEIVDVNTINWYYLNQSVSNIPSSNIDAYSESGINTFEPRESVKGDIARAIMYFYTMYKSEADAADANFFWDQVGTLCEWHNLDPTDSVEWNRTMRIAEHQGGNPNPYVLDCSLAARTFCSEITMICEELTPTQNVLDKEEVLLFPNPSNSEITLQFENNVGSIDVNVFDNLGKHLRSFTYNNRKEITIKHQLLPGKYLVQLKLDDHIINKPIVVIE